MTKKIKREVIWYGKAFLISFFLCFGAFTIVEGPVWAIGNAENALSQVLMERLGVICSIGIMAVFFFLAYKKIKKTNSRQVSTSYWETAETILSDPHTRPELKKAVKALDRMRPVDALQDAVTLYQLQQIRAKETRNA